MLSFIRNNVQSLLIRVIVGVVALVMLFFGVTNFNNQGLNVLATIDGYDIKLDNYRYAYEQMQRRYRQTYKEQAEAMMKAQNLEAQVLQQQINNAVLLKSAAETGLAVTDAELAADIMGTDAFKTDNRFDQEKYNSLLSSNRIDKITFETGRSEELLAEKYQNLLARGASVSRKWLESEFDAFYTQITGRYLAFQPSQFLDQIAPTDEQLKAYYENNKSSYEQEGKYTIRYITYKVEDDLEGATVREKELEKYYERNVKKEFTTKESFKAKHILLRTPQDRSDSKAMSAIAQKANDIAQQLKSTPSLFPELAKMVSEDPGSAANGGDLGWAEVGTFVPEFDNAVKGLKKGEVSAPILSQFGYHIIQLEDTRPAITQPFESVRDAITASIKRKKGERRLENNIARIEKSLGTKGLDELAKESNKPLQTSEPFDSKTNLTNLGYSFELYRALNGKQKSEKGTLQLSGDKGTIVYEVLEHTQSTIKPFETVKTQLLGPAKMEMAKQLVKDRLATYQASVTNQAQFEALAKEQKITPKTITTRLSDQGNPNIKDLKAFKALINKMKVGQIAAFEDGLEGKLFILETKAVQRPENSEKELAELEAQLRQQKAGILLMGLVQEKRKQLEVKYNQAQLQALGIRLN